MSANNQDQKYLAQAIALAQRGVDEDRGGPFGAIIVKGDKVIGEGNNGVTSTNGGHSRIKFKGISNSIRLR